jgi:SpoIIAA-like
MGYELNSRVPRKALYLRMHGEISLQEFIEIDKQINQLLRQCDGQVTLIVDASEASFSPYKIENIKATQSYLQSKQIERIVAISNKKLNRLAMLLLFNLCLPRLQFYDNADQAGALIHPHA